MMFKYRVDVSPVDVKTYNYCYCNYYHYYYFNYREWLINPDSFKTCEMYLISETKNLVGVYSIYENNSSNISILWTSYYGIL